MTEQQIDLRERELDYWMTRAYEAEKRAWQAEARIAEEKRLRMKATAAATKAEARIKAVQHLIDQADEMGEWAITCTRLQWAIDGSAPQPGA